MSHPVTIPDDIDARIDALERNNPDEAEDIARALVYAIGFCPSSVAHHLYMMQDDDRGLRARFRGLAIRPLPGVAEVR